MKTAKMNLVVTVFTCCITICQFVGGLAKAQASTPSQRIGKMRSQKSKSAIKKAPPEQEQVVATAAVRADEEDVEFATAERSDMGGYRVPRTWFTADQTILAPTPLNGMLLSAITLSGSVTKSNVSAPIGTSGVNLNASSSSTSFGPSLKLAYGLSDNFYVMASASYSPSKSETQFTGSPALTNTTSASDGWDEPNVGIGATARVGRTSRITAELNGDIPVGNSRSETRDSATGSTTVSNGLSGGGAISPSLMGLANLGSVKLIGIFSYTHHFERTTDAIQNGRLGSRVTTGGNSFSTGAVLEFPRALNLGIGGIYNRSESNSTTKYNSDAFVSGPETSSSPAQQIVGGMMYMGIPISDTNIVLTPSVMYMTSLERNLENNVSINQNDVWAFTFRGLVHF